MSLPLSARLYKSAVYFIEQPGLRYRWKKKGRAPEVARNLETRLRDESYKDPSLYYQVNIGFSLDSIKRTDSLQERLKERQNIKKNRELELAAKHRTLKVDLEKVYKEWTTTVGASQIYESAKYYNIYNDLFGDAFFYPVKNLSIFYEYENDKEYVTPVYRGNLIKPSEANKEPEVEYEANGGELFTLMFVSPDCHLTEEKGEYLHWLVGNIPGNAVSRGEKICEYMQPFPLRGLGYCRYIFLLFKQEKKIDFSTIQIDAQNSNNLTARNFSTYDFYREHQADLTPTSLAFFESNWDHSLTSFFHNVLDMEEPVVEYDFDPPNLKPQILYPHKLAFNTYMDRYKDPKELGKELLIEKLKETHPFDGPEPKTKYPLADRIDRNLADWLKTDIKRKKVREGKYRFM